MQRLDGHARWWAARGEKQVLATGSSFGGDDNLDMTAPKPLHFQRFSLPLCGVRVECLDEQQNVIRDAVASGFLRRENGTLFLYTAWHVVTGFDPHCIIVGFELPKRRYIRVALQDAQERQPGLQAIGGSQSIVLPLYHDPTAQAGYLKQKWLQNDQHIPHELLNKVGLFVPFWNDVVKIALPVSVRVSEMQVVGDDQLLTGGQSLVTIGEKCLVVGFPYGFSAAIGVDQPTPVVFTRFIASAHIAGDRRNEFFLDGYGAPGMSGGPVFVERKEQLFLFGVYTGDIFPDHELAREKTTALGTVADIRLMLDSHIAMSNQPSSPLTALGSPHTS